MKYEDIRKINFYKDTTLRKFYRGYVTNMLSNSNNVKLALYMACYIDGKLEFDLKLDVAWFASNESTAYKFLSSFDGLKRLIDKGYIEVKAHRDKTNLTNLQDYEDIKSL